MGKPIGQFATLRDKIEFCLDKRPDGCWVWTRAKLKTGYGLVHWKGTLFYVHRAYLMEMGLDIPEGQEVDHLCRVTSCVNPEHLEIVSRRENARRACLARRDGL